MKKDLLYVFDSWYLFHRISEEQCKKEMSRIRKKYTILIQEISR